ncbi:MAG: hypothetical protein KAV87_20800 [Desulfobacteraceae bacterium]|nr:hypothetical protein [Desulfobacteraceae bacterium]
MSSTRIKVIALVGGTNHPTHGRLEKDKEYDIEVSQFGGEIFKPKTKGDEKAVKEYLSSLDKTEEVAAAPPEDKTKEVSDK